MNTQSIPHFNYPKEKKPRMYEDYLREELKKKGSFKTPKEVIELAKNWMI